MDAHYPGSVHNLCQYSRISKDILIAILIANSFLPSPEGGQHFFQLVPEEIVEQPAQMCHVVSSHWADQFIQILIGVTMQTRIRQFYHIGSDHAFRSQGAYSSIMARHSGLEAPKLKVTHALLQGDIPDPGTKPTSPTLALSHQGSPLLYCKFHPNKTNLAATFVCCFPMFSCHCYEVKVKK